MKFKNLPIRFKILSGAMILVAMMLIFGLLAYRYMGEISGTLFGITKNQARALEYAVGVERMAMAAISEEKNFLLERREESYAGAQAAISELNAYLGRLEELAQRHGNDELLQKARTARAAMEEYAGLFKKSVDLLSAAAEAEKVMNRDGAAVVELLTKYQSAMRKEMKEAIDRNVRELLAATSERANLADGGITLANEIRFLEIAYTAHADSGALESMQEKIQQLLALYDEMEASQKDASLIELIKGAHEASIKHNITAKTWARLDRELRTVVLPAMKKSGENAIRQAQSAESACYRSLQEADAMAEAQVSSSNTAILITICLVVVIGLAVSMALAIIITRPIVKGVDFARQVARGDLSAKLDIHQKDEIGVLADSMNALVENLRRMVKSAEHISSGDLTAQVTPLSDKDALGHALRHMVGRLSETMAEINLSASSVAAGSQQLNMTSQAMSQGATEQASSLEEISSSMNEIASQTRQNAENATQASRLSGEAKDLAEKGNAQMQQMVQAMREINDSGRSISRIIKVIDEIAFQTNLLALNAAVEAARAGRHGKGFAVVAEEVRSLAARSAKAARETADLIDSSVRKVEGGAGIADKTAGALSEIVAAASQMRDLVGEIAAASTEQAQGVAQITAGLGQIDQVTQQNTAHAEESASSAQELSSQAMVLQQLVAAFKIATESGSEAPGVTFSRMHAPALAVPGGGRDANGGNGADPAPWPALPAAAAQPGPVIALDDVEFGKY